MYLQNFFSNEPAVIEEAALIMDGSVHPMTYRGRGRMVIPPGREIVTDPVRAEFKRNESFAVNLYIKEPVLLLSASGGGGCYCAAEFALGRCTHVPVIPSENKTDIVRYFFLHRIDVETEEKADGILCFGDSITSLEWPDRLSDRLDREGRPSAVVLRRAIGGSRILGEYRNMVFRHYGRSGLDRFKEEIAVLGIKKIIVCHGLNDIVHPFETDPLRPITNLPGAEEIIGGLRLYIDAAHARHCDICLCTLPPFKGHCAFSAVKEDIRQEVNAWIRGNDEADAFADFSRALMDRADPERQDTALNAGDHIHPNAAGAVRLADSVPEDFLYGQKE